MLKAFGGVVKWDNGSFAGISRQFNPARLHPIEIIGLWLPYRYHKKLCHALKKG